MTVPNPDAVPIAVLSFDRPDILAKVLTSLVAQEGGVDGRRVHLFQDGHYSTYREREVADPAKVRANIAAFRDIVPDGRVHLARRNLGVARNMGRAERYLLGLSRASVAYFFEDDMILAPHYLRALEALAGLALRNERIGYVAAYGDHRARPDADQAALIPMEHNWGFALTRRHWLEREPMLLAYRRLLSGLDYRDRPDRTIRELFWTTGYGIEATSQDGAKHLASLVLGRVRLRCVPCYGHYIGREGLHWSPAFYEASGHGNTQLCLRPPPAFAMPDEARITHLLETERAMLRQRHAALVPPKPASPTPPGLHLPLDGPHFVRLLYRGILGREPDAEGAQHHLADLAAGRTSPERLLGAFLLSEEFKARFRSGAPARP